MAASAPSPWTARASERAAPSDDYVALMTALEVDKACVALKYMESTAVRSKAQQYLESTTQYLQSADGRLSPDEYDAWRAGLDEQARTAAATAGCTQQAMSYVLTAKAVAADQLYQGLLLAFHFDSLPDFDRLLLDGHKKQTATVSRAKLHWIDCASRSALSPPTMAAWPKSASTMRLREPPAPAGPKPGPGPRAAPLPNDARAASMGMESGTAVSQSTVYLTALSHLQTRENVIEKSATGIDQRFTRCGALETITGRSIPRPV